MSVVQVNERLAAVTAAGTGIWLDQLRRGKIESGELGRMVDEDCLRGVTSNPAIFEKAILGSPDYDDDLRSLATQGRSAREVYRYLALKDVQLAADELRPVQRPLWASTGVKSPRYSETMYVDGLVGPDAVNTMPLPTLTAAARSGAVTGATVDQDPTTDLRALRDAGIDLDDVTEKLLREGIDGGARADSVEALLQTTREALDAGVAGVIYGRNIWQAQDPAAVGRSVRALVHGPNRESA